jgi:general secretion pathway protein G
MTRTQNRKGFTLIEILIVVIILGILAAIVIPQFTNASKEAKQSALVTMVQSLRSQISLYKLQHNDNLPDLVTNWNQMTQFSALDGTTKAAKDTTSGHVYGPYMQSVPKNPLISGDATAQSVVIQLPAGGTGTGAAPAGAAFVYDGGATGSGKIWGVDASGKFVEQ